MATVAQGPVPDASMAAIKSTEKKSVQGADKKLVTPGVSLIAGGIGGAAEAAITYPFEFAKTRAQLHQGAGASKNPLAVISKTARQDGVRAIYTGCSTLIFGTAFKAGVRFLSYDAIKSRLADSEGRLSLARGMLAGMCAGVVESVVALTPTERIKTALIDDARSSTRRFNSGFHALRVVIAERGISELYRGLVSTSLKQATTSAVRMGSYNFLKEALTTYSPTTNQKNPAVTFATGSAAGVITVYASQPFDTIKTRAQGAKGATTLEAAADVWRNGGLKAYWRGSTMRLGRLVLSGGIVFTVYENVAGLLMGMKK